MLFRRLSLFLILLIVGFLLIAPVAVHAQDDAPLPPVPAFQPITPQQAGELLVAAIGAIVAGGLGGGPLASFVVGLLKHVVPAPDANGNNGVSAPTLNLLVGGLLTVLFWIAQHFGVQQQFNSISDFLLVAGPALLTLLTTMYSASAVHNAASAQKVAVFGYKRPDMITLRASGAKEYRGDA